MEIVTGPKIQFSEKNGDYYNEVVLQDLESFLRTMGMEEDDRWLLLEKIMSHFVTYGMQPGKSEVSGAIITVDS